MLYYLSLSFKISLQPKMQVIEEIQTSFDHEETIENVGNEETIGDEDLNDKNSFRVSS